MIIHRRWPGRNFDASEFATLDWADLRGCILLDGGTAGRKVSPAAQDITMRALAQAVAGAFAPPLSIRSATAGEGLALWGFLGRGPALVPRFSGAPTREGYGWAPLPSDIAASLPPADAKDPITRSMPDRHCRPSHRPGDAMPQARDRRARAHAVSPQTPDSTDGKHGTS